MNIFRKKEEKKPCCCGGECTPKALQNAELMKKDQGIKILGTGCKKCNMLEANIKVAISQMHLSLEVEHIHDFATIASYGVMTTPALVIQGRVVSYGKVLTVEEVLELLQQVYI